VKILIDKREGKPYRLELSEEATLETGDYSIKEYEDKITFERKSHADLFSCLAVDYFKRFKSQLDRLSNIRYSGLIIESSWKTIGFGHVWSDLPGDKAQERLMRETLKRGVPIYFASSRKQAKEILRHLLCNAFELCH